MFSNVFVLNAYTLITKVF